MICRRCKQQHHDECRGGTWCDCQHRNILYCIAWNQFGPQGSAEHGHFTGRVQCGYPTVSPTPYCEKHQEG